MPKKSKIGKLRKDKFYKLAKETGFRSRASFKLLQLNRKFEFLQKSRVLIDLCAAPGGWLQVARQAMPVSSIIIGVDLVPIQPIANVISLQEDITTDKCRKALKKELKTWKADTILHDGAPNVGKSWDHDAFMQNQLTLCALKLASEMLVKGGWFVTKVFRSKDYLSLVWAFQKLFKRVHTTKPQASRSESAEIFIVCQGYLAPDQIDPKLLDPSYIFKDIPQKGATKTSIEQIIKQKKKAEGYDDDEFTCGKLKASEFIFCDNHLERLGKCSEIVFDDVDIRDHKLTTEEVKHCCKDIKVLGKGDLKLLLNWRKKLEEAIKGLEDNNKIDDELENQSEEEDIDDALKEAEDLELAKLQESKKKKKKSFIKKRKLVEKMNLKMIVKDNEPIREQDQELFTLSQIRNPKELTKVEEENNLEVGLEPFSTDIGDLFENNRRSRFVPVNQESKDYLDHYQEVQEESLYSSDDDLSDELEFESDKEDDNNASETTEAILQDKGNPLMVDIVNRPDRVKDTIEKWFDKEEFFNEQEDDDLELDLLVEKYKSQENPTGPKTRKKEISVAEEKDDDEEEHNEEKAEDIPESKKRKKRVRLDPEGLALGSLLVQSKKMKRDIIESGYNRFSCNDEDLPDWFVENEKKHYRKQLPVTREMILEYKARLREVNARSLKKVVEAKGRKKKRAMKRIENARKRAEKLKEEVDMTDREKAEQLKMIYKNAFKKEKRGKIYVVAKKGLGLRISRPTTGVKGRFKVVDGRMKKDTKKEKMMMKSNKRSKNGQKMMKSNKRNKKGKGKKASQ